MAPAPSAGPREPPITTVPPEPGRTVSARLDDIRSAAGVSGSQLSHYFAGKDELVQAVIGYQGATISGNQRQADLGSPRGLRAWRDMVIAQAKSSQGQGGCPLGSLAGHLPDGTDPDDLAVTLLAALQGGLILAQVQRDTRPLETAIDTVLELARLRRRDVPADGDAFHPDLAVGISAPPE